MNPKIALFLSATLTAFVVATLSGVVNKVTSTAATNETAPQQAVATQAPTATLEPTELPAAAAAVQPAQQPFGPEQAAALAAQAISRQDVYSVETSTYNGVEAYKIVFSSGDVVYIGMDAQVLAQTKLKPVAVNVPATKPPHRDKNNGGGSGGEGENGEKEDGD